MVEQVKDRDLEGQEIEVELPHSAVDRQAKPDTQEQQSSSLYYRIADGFNAVVHLPVLEYILAARCLGLTTSSCYGPGRVRHVHGLRLLAVRAASGGQAHRHHGLRHGLWA